MLKRLALPTPAFPVDGFPAVPVRIGARGTAA